MLGLLLLLTLLAAGCSSSSPCKTPSMAAVPREWRKGNPWNPEANALRAQGQIPVTKYTEEMAGWAEFARQTIKDGDLLFRKGGSCCVYGFDTSDLLADLTDSVFSHIAMAHWHCGSVWIYDAAEQGVRHIPFEVWMLDVQDETLAVSRPRPDIQHAVPSALAYCHQRWLERKRFDYTFGLDDEEFYCSELVEKAFRSAGVKLSDPLPIICFPNYLKWRWLEKPVEKFTGIRVDRPIWAPGNPHFGLYASPCLEPVYAAKAVACDRPRKPPRCWPLPPDCPLPPPPAPPAAPAE